MPYIEAAPPIGTVSLSLLMPCHMVEWPSRSIQHAVGFKA